MRAELRIVSWMLVLALIGTGAKHAISSPVAAPVSDGKLNIPRREPVPEDPESWRREPFKSTDERKQTAGSAPKQSAYGASPDLALHGIMKSSNRYLAIINGRTVKLGDRIDEWTIVHISRYRVTVRREKELQTFDIYQGKINRGTQ